jgi:integrase
VREVHGALRLALRQAVDDGLLARNVAALVKPPKREARSRQFVLSPEQLRRFWRVAEPDRLHALWRLAALVPSRGGELRALTWDDLDARRGLLVIRRSVQRAGDGGRTLITKDPKTRAGTRAVRLDGDLLDVLRRHRARQAEERRRAGPRWCADHGLLFCTRWGTPLLAGNVLRAFRGLLARAGLPTHYRVHDLRHTAVSSLLVAGVPLAEVAQLAGHANPQTTASLYVHAVNRGGRAATAELAAFYELVDDATAASAPAGEEPGATAAPADPGTGARAGPAD